jgi:hypothetical protein
MAERGKSSGKPDLTPDALAPAPGDAPPDTIPILGILGKSDLASNARLFLDVGFSTYYDIPVEGIVEREKVPADRSPLGVDSSILFVRKDIQLVVHHVESRSVEQEFLAGDFTSPGSFTPGPGPQAPGGPIGGPITAATVCTQLGCPGPATAATVCSEFGCPTQPVVCRPSLGIVCTHFQPCGLPSAPPCPSVQPCQTHPPFCPVLSQAPCPSVQPCHTHPPFCPILSHVECPTVQVCVTRPPICQPLSHLPCPSVFCPTQPAICNIVTRGPCPTVQVCHTHPPFCPILSAPVCPSVAGCVTIACGGGVGGGDPGP